MIASQPCQRSWVHTAPPERRSATNSFVRVSQIRQNWADIYQCSEFLRTLPKSGNSGDLLSMSTRVPIGCVIIRIHQVVQSRSGSNFELGNPAFAERVGRQPV